MERGNDSELSREKHISSGLFVGLFLVIALLLAPSPAAHAAGASYVVTETVETLEYEIFEPAAPAVFTAPSPQGLDEVFGPFRVVAPQVAEMTGTVDSYSPSDFREMMRRYPGIRRIEMRDCDGSIDEEANLALARMIRRAGISTHVPVNGSVRSGAVELFLAGITRTAHPSAEFVVHSWIDENGREAKDFPPGHPVHAEYLDYYREMGVPSQTAHAFYALTNSVPFAEQLFLSRADMARYQLLH